MTMPLRKLMLIRNAERPAGEAQGVMPDGTPSSQALTVRGWQRAGALVGLFDADPHLTRPRAIYAVRDRPTGERLKSLRALQTVMPLAEKLHLPINTSFMI